MVAMLIWIKNVRFANSSVKHKQNPIVRAEFERAENQVEWIEVSICQVLDYELFVIIGEGSSGVEIKASNSSGFETVVSEEYQVFLFKGDEFIGQFHLRLD